MSAAAQITLNDDNVFSPMGNGNSGRHSDADLQGDTIKKSDIPIGYYVWHASPRFGDIIPATPDTMPHHFQNANLTDGPNGTYNFLGNMGAPRISRLYFQRDERFTHSSFVFSAPYDFFLKKPEQIFYFNTKSPVTNITYDKCGNKTNGEDRIQAYFAVNINKRLGVGFDLDYLYGRGYYANQSTAHFGGTLFASYIGKQYQMHAYYTANHLKTRENGGIENDMYITNPESFPTRYGSSDMPTRLSKAWNRLNVNTFYLTHRYNLGFERTYDDKGNLVAESHRDLQNQLARIIRADSLNSIPDTIANLAKTDSTTTLPPSTPPAETDSIRYRTEYIPVTSFIHTLQIDKHNRKLTINDDPNNFFSERFLPGDSSVNRTDYLRIANTLAFELHEGFSSWVKSGLRLYAMHEFERYTLPDSIVGITWNQTHGPYTLATQKYVRNYFTVGAQLMKRQGRIFHYDILGELTTTGKHWGIFNVEGKLNFNIPMFKDTLHITANGRIANEQPSFYFEHYHSQFAWWDNNNLNDVFRTRIGGELIFKKTRLSVNVESIQNYAYFSAISTPANTEDGINTIRHAVGVRQSNKNIQVFSATLNQDFAFGIFRWDNELTYQASSDQNILAVPAFSAYTNMYLSFRIAKVLGVEFGADLRYFTKYYAPTYSPLSGTFATQDTQGERVKVGNYPVMNLYANFHLQRCRIYVMASHLNETFMTGDSFLVPHYPINPMTIKFGISWTFHN